MLKIPDRKDYDTVVLGAGASGMISASILLNQGTDKLLLLDEYGELGGNHISRNIGDYSFDIGSFFFQADSPLAMHFPEIMRYYIPAPYTIGRITPRGAVAPYPFSLKQDVLAAGPLEWVRIGLSLLRARIFENADANALAFTHYWLGRRFTERSGLANYMRRFFGVSPSAIEATFAQKRMRWIKDNASLRKLHALVSRKKPRPPMQYVRPREGFPHLYGAVGRSIRERGGDIRLGERINAIAREDQGFRIETAGGAIRTKNLISTMPIEMVTALCGMEPERGLTTVALISLFYSFAGERGFRKNVLYNFTSDADWKRLTMHSDFYGLANDRSYFSVEVVTRTAEPDFAAADRNFREHIQKCGLFRGDLRLEGSTLTRNLYPVYTTGSGEAANRAIAKLKDFGIRSFGKQGGFDYQPTAWVSGLVAEKELSGASVDKVQASS